MGGSGCCGRVLVVAALLLGAGAPVDANAARTRWKERRLAEQVIREEVLTDEALGVDKNFTAGEQCDAWYDTMLPHQVGPEQQCPCGTRKRACLICRKNYLANDDDGDCGYVCVDKSESCATRTVEQELEEEIEEEEEIQEGFIELKYFAVSVVLILIVLIAIGVHKLHIAAMQESMAFIIFGVILGMGIRVWSGENSRLFFEESVEFNSDFFFFVLLPPIILEAGYSLKKARFIRNFLSILAFAFCGTLISTFVVGMMIWKGGPAVGATIENVGIDFETPFDSLKFGAMISATDPVATLSVLSSMRPMKDPDLYSMIFGESVLNDAIAVVLFSVFEKMSLNAEAGVGAKSVASAVGEFFKVSIGSTIVGVLIGCLSGFTTKQATKGSELEAKAIQEDKQPEEAGVESHFEVSIVLLFAYAAYVCADTNGLSGIMALFFCGITMGHYTKYNLSSSAMAVTSTGFHTCAFVAEAAVFTYLGIDFVLADWSSTNGHFHWGFISLSVLAMLVSRAMNIFPIAALLNATVRKGRSMSMKSQFVLWYAGLRGAIAYALAKRWGGNKVTQAVEGTTIILVLLTTFILGSTVGPLVKKLKMEMGEDDELQLSSVASLEQYWKQSAFATEGNDTAATELRSRSDTPDNIETLVEQQDALGTKAHTGFLNLDQTLKKWVGGRASTKAGAEADLAEELSGPGKDRFLGYFSFVAFVRPCMADSFGCVLAAPGSPVNGRVTTSA